MFLDVWLKPEVNVLLHPKHQETFTKMLLVYPKPVSLCQSVLQLP